MVWFCVVICSSCSREGITNLSSAESSPRCSQRSREGSSFVGNKDLGEAGGSCSPALLPHPASRGSHKPLAGCDLAGDFPFASSREKKMPFPAPPGSLLHSNHPPGAQGWALTPSHSQSVNVCSSAEGKHWEHKSEPGSFPGVILL